MAGGNPGPKRHAAVARARGRPRQQSRTAGRQRYDAVSRVRAWPLEGQGSRRRQAHRAQPV